MAKSSAAAPEDPFLQAFRGSFVSALRWHQLDALWQALQGRAELGWYIYAIGEPPPRSPSSAEHLRTFITEIDTLLRREHGEDYCGIVYADDHSAPAFIKIYDPHNLGVSCGYSDNPPLPGWVLSLLPPCDLPMTQRLGRGRRRWWQGLFSRQGDASRQ